MAEEEITANDTTVASSADDFYCDLCKLEFSSKEELQEHRWTMLHHGKLNKAKGRDCVHECTLCEETFVELLSFTKHLHADAHQERYHSWKNQQRSKDWEALNRMRVPSRGDFSGKPSYQTRTNKRKNSNGKDVSFRTRHQFQKESRGGQLGHHHRKRKGNRNLRHFQKDGNSFPVDGSEMGHEHDYEITNDSSIRSESPFFSHDLLSSYRQSPETACSDNPTNLSSQISRSESCWSNRLRRDRQQFSQDATEPKSSNQSFQKGSSWRKQRCFSGSPDTSVFLGGVGEKVSNGNGQPRCASPIMGVPSRSFFSDNITSQVGRSHNEQINDSNIYSEFVPEKRRNSFGNHQNRTRYFRNRTWVSDDFKSRAEEDQIGSTYSKRKFGFSGSLSLEGNDVTRENEISNETRSAAFSRATESNQHQPESFEGPKPTSFNDYQDLGDRDSKTNAQEAPVDVSMSFSRPVGEKNVEQRAYFTFGFPNPAAGSPEEPTAEVIEREQIPLSTRARWIRDSDTKKDKDRGHSPKSLKDSHMEFPSDESSLVSRALKDAKPRPTKSSVTETSSLRRTSPRLRRINVTQSPNSDISSVVGSSEITNTVINAEPKKRNLGNNSMLDEEVERLNALIKMKKEPSDPSEDAETTNNPDEGKVQERQESTRGETSDSQTRCSFVHIDGVQCEALTSDRYCSYHQRFPRGNLIKTEPGLENEKAVLTNTTPLDSSLSSNVLTRDLTNDRDAVQRGDGVRMSNIGTRRHSHSLEDLNNRNADYEHSGTRTVIKRRGSESTPSRPPMKSAIYFHGKEQLSERMRSYRDVKTESSDDTSIPKANSNVEMMDLSMSTNFLVLPHSQVVTSSTVQPTVTSRTTSTWRNVGAQSWKDTLQSGYWNLSNSNTIVTSSSSSVVGQLRENTAPKWSNNTIVKTERQFDVPISPASTPPSLSEPRRGSVSPVSLSVRKEPSVSPVSASSVPSLDLSRLNLPPHVRRALAMKYANRKQAEGASLAASLAPNLSSSRNRFVEAKKDHPFNQEHTETIVKLTDTLLCKPPVTSNVVRGRLRQQRSISLDSCPTSKTLYPDVPNSCGRIVSVTSYEGFPTSTVTSIASGSHAFKVSSASATNANRSGNFSAQPMIDLSASNYIPSLHQTGASKERQNCKNHEATTTHRLVKPDVREFSSTSEGGMLLEKNKVYSHQRTSSLENIPSFLPSVKRSVRAASFERDTDYARDEGESHPPQPSRLVPATGMIKKEGEQLASGLQTSVSATLEKQSSHFKFATVFPGSPRSLIVTPLPSEKSERITLQSDPRISRPLDRGTEHKDEDGGYISLESRARSATPEGTSTNVGRLRQYGLLDLGSTTSSSIKNDQLTRTASLQDRHAINREPDSEMSYPNFKDGADSYDFAPSKRTTTDESDSEERNKRTKGDDLTTSEKQSVNYLPGVDVQELLHLEHEEQKQLKSLQEVQAKAKATRLKLQALSIELEHLNVLEKKISEDISNTKNKRLEILQGALRGSREKSTSETLRTTAKSSAAGNTSSRLQKNVADVERNNNVRDAKGFSSASDALGKSSTILVEDCNVGSMQSERANEDRTISSSAAPIQGNEDDMVVKTQLEFTNPCDESSLTKEAQPITTHSVIDRQETSKTDQSQDMETDHDVPRDHQELAKDSGEGPSSLPEDKDKWVSEHFEKSRKEFFKKIKQQLSTPKKRQQHKKQRKRFSETKVSNSLTVSKERLQLVRERMREWNGDGQQQSQPPNGQNVTGVPAVEAVGHPSTSSTTKDTNLTPSKIPVRDVGDSTKERTNELKRSNNSDLRDKSDIRVKLKSKINVKKKRKSLNPSKKAPSRPDEHVKEAAEQPLTVPQKDKAKSSDDRVQHTDGVDSLKKKPERKTIAFKSLSNSKARASVFDGHTGAVCALKVSQEKLFTCSADKTTKAFDIQTGECVKEYKGHHHAVNCLEISDNGERLFTGSNDQTVRSYNIKTGVCTHKFTFDGRVMCLHIGFGLLYVGLSSGIVTLVDLTTNTCVERLRCHEPRAVSCLATATEGQRTLLCTGSFDATISIRDHKTGLLFKTLTGHSMTVLCMQVVDNILYSGAADAKVLAHNFNTGELLRSYAGHTLSVSSLQVVGRVLVTSCLDKLIRCYDLMSAELLQAYGGQSDMIFSIHLSNGRIYSGTRDGKVSSFKLNLRVYHPCKWKDCQLNFGIISHMKDHIKDFHIIQQGAIDKCLWADCTHVFSDLDNIEAILDHVDGHLQSTKSAT